MPVLGPGDLIKQDSLAGLTLIVKHKTTLLAARAINTTAADAYVQFFDAAAVADVTLGTTRADWVIVTDFPIEVSSGDGLPTNGLNFEKGIVAASTTTAVGSTTATQHLRLVVG
jgi:hypothetical protein